MQQPPAPLSERLRKVRTRVTVGVLATFVAAWLAVAAFGKGGAETSGTAAPTSTQAAPSDGTEFGGPGSSGDYGAQSDDSGSSNPAQSHDSGSSSSSGPGPVTSSQS